MRSVRFVGIVSLFIGAAIWLLYTLFWTMHDFPFVWLPITLFFSIGLSSLLWPKWQSRRQNKEVDALLLTLFPQMRLIHWAVAQVCLAAALFLFGIVFWRWDLTIMSSMWKTAVISFLVGLSIFIGLRSLRLMLRHDDKSYTTLQYLLNKHLDKIIWVYDMPMQVNSETELAFKEDVSIYIWLENGEVYPLTLPQAKTEYLFTFLQEAAPQAILGYNLELAKRYQESVPI